MSPLSVTSIRKKEEFDKVFKEGSRRTGKLVSVLIKKNAKDFRIGIIVNKKFGSAARRNRIKRLIREAYRKLIPDITGPMDMVVIPRPAASGTGTNDIFTELKSLILGEKV